MWCSFHEVTWYLSFQVNDAEAETRYRYILKALRRDKHVSNVLECVDRSSREVTVYFKSGLEQPDNPALHHLRNVFGILSLHDVKRVSMLDRILTESPLDVG